MSPVLLLAAILAVQGGGARAARPAAPPPAATVPGPPTEWPFRFHDFDYPAAATRNEEEGTTRYRVEIGPDGRVARCTIIGSSGSSALDQTTCRIVMRRARFTPARNRAGKPVRDTREAEVTWRMDEE